MLRIKKRDGGIEDFDIAKIENAIEKAFMAEHKFYNRDIIQMLALRVTAEFNKKGNAKDPPDSDSSHHDFTQRGRSLHQHQREHSGHGPESFEHGGFNLTALLLYEKSSAG